MMSKYAVFAALFCCSTMGVRGSAQLAAPADASGLAVAESSGTDQSPLFMEKLNGLKAQIHAEYAKKREATPEEARSFRSKAVTLSIEYHNMLHQKVRLRLIGTEEFEIHELIYARPKIAARLFGYELEICKSTDAYDYKAQAEVVAGDRAQAEADWTAAIAMAPETELLRHRGHLYLGQRKYDKAIEDFSRAIKAGGVAPLYHSRAMAYYRGDNYAGAAEDLEQFFKLNTDKDFSRSVASSRICSGLRKHGFAVEGCAAQENGGEKK